MQKYILPLIVLLSFYGSVINGCVSGKTASTTGSKLKTAIKMPDTLVQKQLDGVDLFADGDIPNRWTLEMDFDNGYKFKSNDGINFSTAAYKATSVTDSLKTYDINTSQGEIKIRLFSIDCANRKKRAEVIFNNTRYYGCSGYLYNPKLSGKWILEKINGDVVTIKDFKKGIPEIQFDLTTNTMNGTDGCDKINSVIALQGSRIAFSEIVLSAKSCPTDLYQKIIREKIRNNLVSYYFKEGKLYLYLIDDSTLIFRKG